MKQMNYIQLPLSIFLQLHPEFVQMFPMRIFHDERYVVRLQPDNGLMEVGFLEDNWKIS